MLIADYVFGWKECFLYENIYNNEPPGIILGFTVLEPDKRIQIKV